MSEKNALEPPANGREWLCRGEHTDPHAVLGAHPDRDGVVVRAFHPDAAEALCVIDGVSRPMKQIDARGLFATRIANARLPLLYELRFEFADGNSWQLVDPYRFAPTLGDQDLHYIGEGSHRRLWHVLGAHPRRIDAVDGTSFAVWAPTARRVSVIGDFCNWDGRLLPMRAMGASGVFELFVPGVFTGAR